MNKNADNKKTHQTLLAPDHLQPCFWPWRRVASQPADNGAEKINVTIKITAPDKEIINEDIQIDKGGRDRRKKQLCRPASPKKLAYTNDSGLR